MADAPQSTPQERSLPMHWQIIIAMLIALPTAFF